MNTVLITGCGSGMGAATALHLARGGDRVFAGVRRMESAGLLQAAARNGLPISVLQLDINDTEQVERAIGDVLASTSRIDTLINNAGVSFGFTATECVSDEDTKAMFETNFFSPLRLIRAVLPTMRAQGSGTIVNVSALAGLSPRPYLSVYSASKSALEALSLSLAAEVLEFGIRVVIVAPGSFKTGSQLQWRSPSIETGVERYRIISEGIRENTLARKAKDGRDPIAVAVAITNCIHAESPPARLTVGEDSERSSVERRAQGDDEYVLALAAGLAQYQ